MKYNMDVIRIRENSIQLNGWVVGEMPGSKPESSVEDETYRPLGHKYVSTKRGDVNQIYYNQIYDRDFGFDIRFPYKRGKDYYLVIRCDGRKASVKYNGELIAKRSNTAHKRLQKVKDLMNVEIVHVAIGFEKKHGLKALVLKSKHKLQGLDSDYDYAEWYRLTEPTEEELAAQWRQEFSCRPKFSIVVPVFRTSEKYLEELLDPILAQTYDNWGLYIADGSPAGEGMSWILERYVQKNDGIRYQVLGENQKIAGNTNAAMEMVAGDYITLADRNDVATPNALYECVKMLNEDDCMGVLYSDEDKLDMDGGMLSDPYSKPNFNPDLLTSVNYICHLFVVKRSLVKQVGGFREGFDGAQDYDFILRCTEGARRIHHIPKVLYHWRCHQEPTADNPESRFYAFEAGSRVIMAHYERMGTRAEEVKKGVDYGVYHTTFKVQEGPLVPVIIPNKDHHQDLGLCIRSIIEKGTYPHAEFVVVEDSSSQPGTFSYYEKIQREFPQVQVVMWGREFNHPAANDFGETYANGEYLLFLSNGVELIATDFVGKMLGFVQWDDVGIADTGLLYQDDTIQHASVMIDFGDIVGHTFIDLHRTENGYFHRAMYAQDYSAVTATCVMMRKSLFDQVGNFTEELAVAFNDIDYRMKICTLDKLVVYAPYVVLHRYKSRSRGLEDTPEKVTRFNREVTVFAKKWPETLRDGGPYCNPNLALHKSNFAPRDLKKEGVGEPYRLGDTTLALMEGRDNGRQK